MNATTHYPPMDAAPGTGVSRRGFLASTGLAAGGLMLGFHVPLAQAAADPRYEINAWVVVKPDDTVVIRIARSEMGQGTLTGLAQLVAEELECHWARVTTELPTPGQNLARQRVWGSFATGGSRGIRDSHDYVRRGGAMARMMLIQAAANDWGVPATECTAANGIITHKPTGRKTLFGRVTLAAAQLPPPDPASVVLKDPASWKLVGKRLLRLDTFTKTTGQHDYGVDLRLPGMLNAAIRDCPVFGGRLKSYNAAAVLRRAGVKRVVPVGTSAVAVVAETWWQAHSALKALPVEWDLGPHAGVQQADIRAALDSGLDGPATSVGNEQGDVATALATAVHKIESVYSYPHQAHATLEPMNATARWTAERCQVWAPTQNGEAALEAAAAAAGLPIEQCEVHKLSLGGGFGRRGRSDYITQAVQIAKALPGTPIKLIWSREEDMQHGYYHPATAARLSAALDEQGNLTGLHMRISGQSILSTVAPQALRDGKDMLVYQGLSPSGPEATLGYTLPNLLIDHAMRNPHVPAGFWRGVNLNQNTLYLECFLDEIAHATGQDPLALRRKLMANHPKHLAVLDAVAQRAGWGRPAAPGVHRGLAQCMGFGSFVAACAEVSVSAEGKLRIHRIVAATDCGHAVNPQQIEAQVEGSFVFGLSAALFGEITVRDGAVAQKNFDDYPVMRLADMPRVETIVMPSGGFWGGVGEPTIAVAAPAVLNAIFAATGRRIRELPLKQHDLRRA